MLYEVITGFLFSADRKHINWSLVIKGILLQVVLALLILKAPYVEGFFEFLSRAFVKVVDMAHEGATFVFGSFIDGTVNPYVKNFATWILPSVIFFSALTSLMYYWGILQRVVMGRITSYNVCYTKLLRGGYPVVVGRLRSGGH